MTQRQAAAPAPGPLEAYAQSFDDLFERRNQREAFRRYVEGLLVPAERNKTLTALGGAEPIIGAQQARLERCSGSCPNRPGRRQRSRRAGWRCCAAIRRRRPMRRGCW